MIAALYNEIDPFAARWLRGLVSAGHIAPGVVDERSIAELAPADVHGPGQRHFFAGIAGWSLALRLAGVPDDADVWTGSCPCQSLSDAGKRSGFDDARHLWPAWFSLIAQCRPSIVFGEQVASSLGLEWLDLVFSDLEGAGYTCAAADLCAAGAGAPHQRQRLFFVAYADGQPGRLLAAQRQPGRADTARQRWLGVPRDDGARREQPEPARGCTEGGVGDSDENAGRRPARGVPREEAKAGGAMRGSDNGSWSAGSGRLMADAASRGRSEGLVRGETGAHRGAGSAHGGWQDCDWIPCSDGVSRPVESGTHPLAHGVPGRVGLLRGYGNAIVPQVAAAFIRAALEARVVELALDGAR